MCSNYCDDIEVGVIKDVIEQIRTLETEVNILIRKNEALKDKIAEQQLELENSRTESNTLKSVCRMCCKDQKSKQKDINNIRAEIVELQRKNSDLEIELKAMRGAEVERLRKGLKNLLNELTEKGTSVSLVDGHIEAEK